EVLGQVIAGGRAARWFELLVKNKKQAAEIETFDGPGDAAPNLFVVYATAQGATSLATLDRSIRDEVTKLRNSDVTREELARAKKSLRAETVRSLETNIGLATRLADTAQITGDPYYLERRLRQIDAVTSADLQAFAKTY